MELYFLSLLRLLEFQRYVISVWLTASPLSLVLDIFVIALYRTWGWVSFLLMNLQMFRLWLGCWFLMILYCWKICYWLCFAWCQSEGQFIFLGRDRWKTWWEAWPICTQAQYVFAVLLPSKNFILLIGSFKVSSSWQPVSKIATFPPCSQIMTNSTWLFAYNRLQFFKSQNSFISWLDRSNYRLDIEDLLYFGFDLSVSGHTLK